MHFMQALFRSEAQVRLLTQLYLRDDAQSGISVRELARRIGTSEATASREVSRLVSAGAASERRVGNQRLVGPAPDSALTRHLVGLLRAVAGPEVVLRKLVGERTDLERAAIFGSFAARLAGEPGPPPGDIDLLLVGQITFEDAYDLAHLASLELGIEVNPVVRHPDEWDHDTTGFATSVREGPVIDLLDQDAVP